MKVGQLLGFLRDVDPHREVFLSIDEEGNAFYPLADVDVDAPYREHSAGVDVKHPDDALPSDARGVVLWP